MKLCKFKSGTWQKGYKYQYFLPEKIDHEFVLDDSKTQNLLEKASRKLGELNSFARFVPDIEMFIKSYVTKEAVTSSRIEGTRTNIEEAFSDELDINPEHRDDWVEVNQYVKAMNYALEQLGSLPLSNRLIRNMHKVLLSQVRGEHKAPGEFRKSQNWIGGATIDDAVFVPPNYEHVVELMSDLEKFLHNEDIHVPHLVKIAIAHYQFETIHPFLDGNGRTGRLLITLYLVSQKIIEKPLLYTSDFFERNKRVYYDKLSYARDNNDLTGWIRFFLVAVEQTAEKAVTTLADIMALRAKISETLIPGLGRKGKNAQTLLTFLFSHPRISVKKVEQEIGLTPRAANALVQDFLSLGILKEITGYKRNRLFEFSTYLEILKR
jgi:Fic family protein